MLLHHSNPYIIHYIFHRGKTAVDCILLISKINTVIFLNVSDIE